MMNRETSQERLVAREAREGLAHCVLFVNSDRLSFCFREVQGGMQISQSWDESLSLVKCSHVCWFYNFPEISVSVN